MGVCLSLPTHWVQTQLLHEAMGAPEEIICLTGLLQLMKGVGPSKDPWEYGKRMPSKLMAWSQLHVWCEWKGETGKCRHTWSMALQWAKNLRIRLGSKLYNSLPKYQPMRRATEEELLTNSLLFSLNLKKRNKEERKEEKKPLLYLLLFTSLETLCHILPSVIDISKT